ncbi:MAG: TPM domain-containing protein [Spirochaetota bacterium]
MAQILSDNDRGRLDKLVEEAEKSTNAQIVLAAVKRSDSYAELPWKAFALGASVAGLLVFYFDLLSPGWGSDTMVLVSVASILAAGAAFALLAIVLPVFGRLFLSADRAETEVRQYAESLFLSREIFATSGRTGILMLISMFEREIVILPDKGLANRLSENAMQNIILKMTAQLKRNEIAGAMETGVKEIGKTLGATASAAIKSAGKDELSNEIIEEKGV